LNDKYYATKINNDHIYGKYKLGFIKDFDSNHLSKLEFIFSCDLFICFLLEEELDRIERELIDEKGRESGKGFM
jgi:hypothetical protein